VLRGVVYFCLVFGVGFILGTIRVLWVVPHLGVRTAELIEAPLMLAATYLAARYATRRFRASRRVEYLYSGLLALILLLIMEFSVVLGLQGLSIREYLAGRDPVAGAVYVVMLIVFALMPWLIGKELTTD
tara:strand:+ start:2428 stop:2817 length:390 start_codon:yes stop_codon:yes gene_type:complete